MLQQYLAELQKIDLLELEEELALWRSWAEGDQGAYRKIITAYQPLVFKIAMAFRLAEAQTLELIQEGTVGLLEAAEKFDYERGVAFSIFASHRIRGRMLDFLQVEYGSQVLSLDGVNSVGLAWSECLVSDEASPFELAERNFLNDKIAQAMERLPQKEQQVLTGIYLEDKSAGDLAAAIDVSLGHIYRLQKQGVRRVRGMLSRLMSELNKS
ncbi:MAG: sigma-70 family RNA polymerase sigma factor [Phascolarctobacterium sp.]|uniref:sigma-70 family RNA polymerase sigma factor n=1 Tax=Phascolarctobacterium sp. TaxID=2049039 RepID=UPI0025E4BBF3|nr:sigma-70 family RNA polymerase sigma factor [Phascolarctobacterium sp.]MCC8158296.1 sigma-70 family RNA polymerase sigma factor [Phascolarctobacterium sp.]